jgi:hypothetical protein
MLKVSPSTLVAVPTGHGQQKPAGGYAYPNVIKLLLKP